MFIDLQYSSTSGSAETNLNWSYVPGQNMAEGCLGVIVRAKAAKWLRITSAGGLLPLSLWCVANGKRPCPPLLARPPYGRFLRAAICAADCCDYWIMILKCNTFAPSGVSRYEEMHILGGHPPTIFMEFHEIILKQPERT